MLFTQTHFGALLLTFWLYSLAMCALGLFLATLVSAAQPAQVCGVQPLRLISYQDCHMFCLSS